MTHRTHPTDIAFLRACRRRSRPHLRHEQSTGNPGRVRPRTAHGPGLQARGGVVHVLGSASALIGTPDRGGTERRPIRRAAHARNLVQAESVSGEDVAEGWRRPRVHRAGVTGLRNGVEGRVDAAPSLVPPLFPLLTSSTPRPPTAYQGREMVVRVREDHAFDLRTTRRESLGNHR